MRRPKLLFSGILTVVFVLFGAHAQGEEQPQEEASATDDLSLIDDSLPLGATRRWILVEPLGLAPSPWIALSASLDAGVTVNGQKGWTAVRVHIPVARHYGAIDIRLVAELSGDGLDSLGPEFTLRGAPLRLAQGRGSLGFAAMLTPQMRGTEPVLTVGGGLMGGFVDRRWFTWAFLGVRSEVLQRGHPELVSTISAGLRLPYGLRPQVEVEIIWESCHRGDLALVVRPGLRYWPARFIGIGLSADIRTLGDEISTSAIRIDIIAHPAE